MLRDKGIGYNVEKLKYKYCKQQINQIFLYETILT